MATFRPSLFSLRDKKEYNSPRDYKYLCTLCQLERKKLPAVGFCINCDEYLCHSCYGDHSHSAASENHTLLEKSKMPKKWANTTICDDLDERCEKHTGKVIEFYCERCQELGCISCMEVSHQVCNVVYIPAYLQGKDLHCYTYRYEEEMQKQMGKVTDLKWLAELHCRNAHEKVRTFRKEVNNIFDRHEYNIHKEIDKRTQKILEVSESHSKKIELIHSKLKELNQFHFRDSEMKANKFVNIKLFEEAISDYEKFKDSLATKAVETTCKFHFKPNDEFEKWINEPSVLGNICEIPDKGKAKTSIRLKYIYSLSVTTCFKEHVRYELLPRDSIIVHTCNIMQNGKLLLKVDVCNVGDSLLYLCDIVNALDDTEQGSRFNARFHIICVKDLKNYFKEMAEVDAITFAITVPQLNKIQFVKVKEADIETERSIDVKSECSGIGCIGDKLIVSFSKLKKVEIMDLFGEVLITVPALTSSFLKNYKFDCPEHIACDTERKIAYITDNTNNCIMAIDMNGKVTAVIRNNPNFYGTDMIRLLDIAVGNCGSVLVAVDNPYSIQMISSNFLERDVLVFKGNAWRICSITYHGNKLYFGNRNGLFFVAELSNDFDSSPFL